MNKSKVIPIVAGAAAVGVAATVISYKAFKYSGIKLKKCITVDRSPEELYRYWRNFENLPRFMDMLDSVEVLDDRRSRWTVSGPGGVPVTWDAEITVDRPNEMIGWCSLKGSTVETKGYVRFERANGGRGTVVRVAMQYVPPAGKAGAAVATLVGKRPGAEVDEALRRFKQLMEAGEIATATKSTIRRTAEVRRLDVPNPAEEVEVASDDSFPASDPPSWTGTGV
jgi:uncharacterized membrane protein